VPRRDPNRILKAADRRERLLHVLSRRAFPVTYEAARRILGGNRRQCRADVDMLVRAGQLERVWILDVEEEGERVREVLHLPGRPPGKRRPPGDAAPG